MRALQSSQTGFLDGFHSPPVDAQVGIPDTRRGAKLDELLLGVNQKLDIVDKTEPEAAAFDVEVIVCLVDNSGSWQLADD